MFHIPPPATEAAISAVGVAFCLTCLAVLTFLDARRRDWIAALSWTFACVAISMSLFILPIWATALSLAFSGTALVLMLLRIWRAARDPQWREIWRR
jgi:hypothetical protein